MEWFSDWWQTLELAEQILYCIAIPASLILVIQTIMVLAGFGHGGEGVNFSDTSGIDFGGDVSGGMDMGGDITDIGDMGGLDGADASRPATHDGSNPGDFGTFSLFTIQGIIAFLTVFGWSGIISLRSGLPLWAALIIGFVLGFLAMFGVAKIIQLSARLAQNGSFVMKNLLGLTGTVYLTIPASGCGKVMVQTEERFVECDAMTDDGSAVPTNTAVRVVDIRGGSIAVVEKV